MYLNFGYYMFLCFRNILKNANKNKQTDSVNYVTNTKGMYCLLDLHNYHRYRDQVIGSTAVPYTALTDVWQRLATLYKDNPRMIWGTMNEPYGITYLAAKLGANAAIKGIRDAGATVRPNYPCAVVSVCVWSHTIRLTTQHQNSN
jgi:hypothetical protein